MIKQEDTTTFVRCGIRINPEDEESDTGTGKPTTGNGDPVTYYGEQAEDLLGKARDGRVNTRIGMLNVPVVGDVVGGIYCPADAVDKGPSSREEVFMGVDRFANRVLPAEMTRKRTDEYEVVRCMGS